ncbi:hypothetical protein CAEBREN_07529 [Caenorhabditis brenneri]|uniref:Sdz-33 F-box domain-containing protein n=1 Tax=Caenorhabditis brenneri TaxID=135651 RepID=G0MM17_CAEBE|nr:hypothetical protein CAEBREN_07529 [Caenorhabditis brenneri]
MADLVSFINYNGKGHQKCTISDLNVNFGVTVATNDKVKDYFILVHTNVKDIIPTVQKHILSFFQTSVPSYLDIRMDEDLPDLPKIEGVEESSLSGENLEGTFVERVCNTYPNQKCFKIYSRNFKNSEKSSKLFDLDCLYIKDSSTISPMALKHFKGSHLYLFNSELKMEDVMQFFQRWKSGEARNLEYLSIYMADFVSFINYNGNGHQKCTISDLNVNFGLTVPTDDKIKDYFVLVHTNVKDIIPAVQKHILSFFQTPVPSRLAIKIDKDLHGLPKIDGVEESTLSGENLEGAFVERFFSMYPNQKRSRILAKNIENLEETSKLFDLDCLSIEYSTTTAPMALKHFKGSHLFLFNSELKIEDVMQFFQRWKSGEAHQNLEYLYIKLKSGDLNIYFI